MQCGSLSSTMALITSGCGATRLAEQHDGPNHLGSCAIGVELQRVHPGRRAHPHRTERRGPARRAAGAPPPLPPPTPPRPHETVQDMFITPLYQQHVSHTLASRAYGPQPHMQSSSATGPYIYTALGLRAHDELLTCQFLPLRHPGLKVSTPAHTQHLAGMLSLSPG